MVFFLGRWFERKAVAGEGLPAFAAVYGQATEAYVAGDFDRAIPLYDQAILIDSSHAEAHYKRANALKNVGQLKGAIDGYDNAVRLNPEYSFAYCNRGAVQQSLGLTVDALSSYDRAIALDPGDVSAHYNRALVLQDLHRWEEAVGSYDRAIGIVPDFADAQYNRAVALLFLGDFERGWRGYEWRWKNAGRLGIGEAREFPQPLWSGAEPLVDRRILLHSEAGLGDTIQFCRYALDVADRGALVFLEVQPALVGLLGSLPGVSSILPKGSPIPDVDFHSPLMSLPLAFKTTPETIPTRPAYLRSDPLKVASWRARLGKATAPRVGLAWSGNPRNPIDARRTLAVSEWLPFLPREFSYVCVQKDIRPDDSVVLQDNPWIRLVSDHLVDFSDTAALCDCMDVVISVDTSVAHLSASLGRPTWLLLAYVPDWRWMREREDTPWYPSARLYRQRSPGDWIEVFERVSTDLRNEFGGTVG